MTTRNMILSTFGCLGIGLLIGTAPFWTSYLYEEYSEVSAHDYNEIALLISTNPDIGPYIKERLSDSKITKHEWDSIKKEEAKIRLRLTIKFKEEQ